MNWNKIRKIISRTFAFLTALMMVSVGGIQPIAKAEEEPTCGLQEHEHTDACFVKTLVCGLTESVPEVVEERYFASNFQIHVHTADCFDSEGNALCGMAENVYYHEHNSYCYDQNGSLVCGLSSVPRHYHSDACYSVRLELACGQEEREPEYNPETGETMDEGHFHTADCYGEVWVLACDYAKVHEHSDACYNGNGTVHCGFVSIPEFVCKQVTVLEYGN